MNTGVALILCLSIQFSFASLKNEYSCERVFCKLKRKTDDIKCRNLFCKDSQGDCLNSNLISDTKAEEVALLTFSLGIKDLHEDNEKIVEISKRDEDLKSYETKLREMGVADNIGLEEKSEHTNKNTKREEAKEKKKAIKDKDIKKKRVHLTKEQIKDEVERELESNTISRILAAKKKRESKKDKKVEEKKDIKDKEKKEKAGKKSQLASRTEVSKRRTKSKFPWKSINDKRVTSDHSKKQLRKHHPTFQRHAMKKKEFDSKSTTESSKKSIPKSKYSRFQAKRILRFNEDMFRAHDRP